MVLIILTVYAVYYVGIQLSIFNYMRRICDDDFNKSLCDNQEKDTELSLLCDTTILPISLTIFHWNWFTNSDIECTSALICA